MRFQFRFGFLAVGSVARSLTFKVPLELVGHFGVPQNITPPTKARQLFKENAYKIFNWRYTGLIDEHRKVVSY